METGDIKQNVPNVARMYDYYLGGTDNFPADRAAADQVLELVPHIPAGARENRAFLGRAVRYLVANGVTQFLDIGAGLPTQSNVHQVAGVGARTVYVDHDPQVVTHARALIDGNPDVTVLEGDLRRPQQILNLVRGTLDFGAPIAVLLLAVVHFVQDEDRPKQLIDELMAPLVPGSHLVLSHVCSDRESSVERIYEGASARFTTRSAQEITPFFDGLDLVEPGVVDLPQWRPELREPGAHAAFLCGVARKP